VKEKRSSGQSHYIAESGISIGSRKLGILGSQETVFFVIGSLI
jgi:hypothetical protein